MSLSQHFKFHVEKLLVTLSQIYRKRSRKCQSISALALVLTKKQESLVFFSVKRKTFVLFSVKKNYTLSYKCGDRIEPRSPFNDLHQCKT